MALRSTSLLLLVWSYYISLAVAMSPGVIFDRPHQHHHHRRHHYHGRPTNDEGQTISNSASYARLQTATPLEEPSFRTTFNRYRNNLRENHHNYNGESRILRGHRSIYNSYFDAKKADRNQERIRNFEVNRPYRPNDMDSTMSLEQRNFFSRFKHIIPETDTSFAVDRAKGPKNSAYIDDDLNTNGFYFSPDSIQINGLHRQTNHQSFHERHQNDNHQHGNKIKGRFENDWSNLHFRTEDPLSKARNQRQQSWSDNKLNSKPNVIEADDKNNHSVIHPIQPKLLQREEEPPDHSKILEGSSHHPYSLLYMHFLPPSYD